MAGQMALSRVPEKVALPAGCAALSAGLGLVALALVLPSLAALVAGGAVAGLGQGLSFRAGLAAITEASPADRRAEVASIFFIVGYVAISLPVVGVGLVAQLSSLLTAGLIFAAAVAALALTVLALLSTRTPSAIETLGAKQ
jgi:hypothetical protein